MSHKHIYFAPKNPDGTYGAIGRADYDDELHDKEIIMAGFIGKEIIPCKDCIWWCECRTKDKFPYKKDSCNKFGTKMNADDFCSRGEKR